MAVQIVILDTGKDAGTKSVRAALWFPIAQARRVPVPGATSSYRNATAPELTSLADGSTIEEVVTRQYSITVTVAAIKSDLQTLWTARKAEIDARPDPNQFYGASWDGTTWST